MMNVSMRLAIIGVITITLCPGQPAAGSVRTSSLANLSELPKLANMLAEPGMEGNKGTRAAIRSEVSLIGSALKRVALNRRATALREVADRTPWGSPQRKAAYYVCAWYGVNYARCRDYLLNTAYWSERGLGQRVYNEKTYDAYPYSWIEGDTFLLYQLYEHNHDFRLLHEIITTESDAHISECIAGVTGEAFGRHPRGILHAASMSRKARGLAVAALSAYPKSRREALGEGGEPYAVEEAPSERLRVFHIYVTRVAADAQDPLSPLARSLLRESRRCKPDRRR